MAKRQIRLKEYPPGSDAWVTPSAEYLARTDGTMGEGPFRCRSDKNGFIATGNNKSTSAKPVVFLGDSFVESVYAAEADRFVSATERALTGFGLDVQCLNGGYSGSTTLQILNVLVNKVYPVVGPGGSVVLFGPHSDRDYLYKQGTYWSETARGATVLPPGDPGHEDIPRGIASAEMVLRILVVTAAQLGLSLVLATTPYRTGDYDKDPIFPANYHGRRDWFDNGMTRRRDWTRVICNTAEEFGLPLINTEAYFAGDSSYFYDELHLNPAGQAKLTGYLANELLPILRSA